MAGQGQVYPDAPVPMHFTKMFHKGNAHASLMPPPAAYSKPKPRRYNLCCGFVTGCCCAIFTILCTILFIALVILGIAALVVWLVLRPIEAPTYSLDSLQLNAFSVNTTLSSSPTLDANFVYTITATNANRKIGIKYDEIAIDTSYNGVVFGHSSVPSFFQGHRNTTTFTSGFDVRNFALGSGGQSGNNKLSSLTTDYQNGSVALHTHANAKLRVKIGAYTSFAVWVHVDCDVVVATSSSSPATVSSKTCKLSR